MLKPNKKIGIVYCENSKKYVEEVQKIINKKREEGHCVETIVVESSLDDHERMIDRFVFGNLEKCDYGLVFLTKDLLLLDTECRYASRPNVMLELGYLRGRLEENCICCVIDFPHEETKNGIYMLPSDLAGIRTEEIDANNYTSNLRKVVDAIINTEKIIKLNNYNANDLVSSLILNSNYKTEYEELFTSSQILTVLKYSVKYQLEEIFKLWIEEKNKLSDVGQIIYLFERIVFLPFFPEKIISGKLSDFLSVRNNEGSEYVYICRRILHYINEYENHKRRGIQYKIGIGFYLEMAENLEEELEKFKNKNVAPIIESVTKNYIGLNYLNFYLTFVNSKKDENTLEQQPEYYLGNAKKSFEDVIRLSERNFSDKVDVLGAFGKYNLARVKKNLGEDADTEYNAAIYKRGALAETSNFPEIFKLNFTLERIHAEIDYYDYLKEKEEIDTDSYMLKMQAVYEELKNIRQTPAADVSLFQTLDNKIALRYKP